MQEENSSTPNKVERNNNLEIINIERLLSKFFKFSFLFPIFLFITLSMSWYYANYIKSQIYEAESIIYMGNEKSNVLPQQSVINFMWGGNVDKMYTQKSYLDSRSHNQNVAKKLDLYINYYEEGEIKKSPLYINNTPYIVKVDTSHIQTIGMEFSIKPIDEKTYYIEPLNSGMTYLYSSDVESEDIIAYKNNQVIPFSGKKIKYGSWLVSDNMKFKIEKSNLLNFAPNSSYSFILSDMNSAINRAKSGFEISILAKDYSLISITKKGRNLQESIDIINTSIDLSIQLQLDQKNRVPNNTIAFIEKELSNIRKDLESSSQLYQGTKEKEQIVDIDAQGNSILEILNNLDQTKASLVSQIETTERIKKSISNGTLSELVSPSSNTSDQVYSSAIQNLAALELSKQDLLNFYQPNSDRVLEVENQIRNLKKQANASINQSILTIKESLQDINQRISKYESQLNRLPKKEQKYVNVKREYDLNNSVYNEMLRSLNSSKVLKASNVSDVIVIDPAVDFGQAPIEPKKSQIYLVGLIVGLAIPFIIIILIELLDNKIKVLKDITLKTDMPIAGAVGKMINPDNKIVINKPKSGVSESFRALRSDVRFLLNSKSGSDFGNKTILITSSISGEGKTFISINLASVFAMSGKKTLLIGMDLRKPKMFNYFDISNDVGLSTYLIGSSTKNEIIKNTELENLKILPAGPIPPNPSELLMTQRNYDLLNELKNEFDIIIIDTPPIGLVSDSFELMNRADASLYVVRQGYTTKSMLRPIAEKYKNKEVKNIGIVLNNYSVDKLAYGYGYGYGYFEDEVEQNPKSMKNRIDKLLSRILGR